MRGGEKRLNRLRRAAAVCRPSCNGAALDRFAWLSPWHAGGGGAGRRKPGLPHLLNLRDWSGGWLRTCERSDLWRSVAVEEWGCAGLSNVAAIAAVQRISRQGAAAAGVCAALRNFFLRGAKLIERDRVAALARRFVRSSTARRLAAQRTGRAAPSVRGIEP